MEKNQSKALCRIALLGVGAVILASCGGKQGGKKMGDNEFAVEQTSLTVSNQTTEYPATIRGLQDIEIRPQVSGFIVGLCVDEGATVHKGQALFKIDETQYRAAYNQAVANLKAAQAQCRTAKGVEENKKLLFEQKIISDFEFQTAVNDFMVADAALAQANAALIAAKQNLDFCTVTSPSDGVVGTFPYRIGSLVSPQVQQPLTTVSKIGNMYVYFSMTEKQLLEMTKTEKPLKEQLAEMPKVKLMLSDRSIYEAEGTIDAVSGVIDQTTGSVSMRAIFPNDKNILRSGGMANIVFPYDMEEVILVPQWATQEVQDKKFVFVLQNDSTIKYTEVEVSELNDGQNYIVTGGIEAGETIVIEGVQTLKDGQKIVPITKEQKEAKFQQAVKDQREGNIATAFS